MLIGGSSGLSDEWIDVKSGAPGRSSDETSKSQNSNAQS